MAKKSKKMGALDLGYEVINRDNNESHGRFKTLEEARGAVAFDRLTSWVIDRDGWNVESKWAFNREVDR